MEASAVSIVTILTLLSTCMSWSQHGLILFLCEQTVAIPLRSAQLLLQMLIVICHVQEVFCRRAVLGID